MQRFPFRWWIALVLLGIATASPSTAIADERVRFASAAPRNASDVPRRAARIDGYLTRPKGSGPFPAVVVLHSCLGLRADRAAMAKLLAGWGYVGLFVDDFATRGLTETCAVDFPEGVADAFGALGYLAGLPDVDKDRIAVIGYSQGGDTALRVAVGSSAAGFALPQTLRFKAAAAFYPPCGNLAGAAIRLPTLILIGAADTVTPAAQCQQLAGGPPAGKAKLVIYPNAGHVFDDPAFAGGRSVQGMWLEFNARAAAQSRSALHDFLAAELKQ
jgi:dienelactone hydrolase